MLHDWYGSYSSSTQTNPTGPNSASYRVLRGGSWYYNAEGCRVAYRYYYSPGSSYNYIGFRVSRTRK
ncbi:MAG TPA: SUMF1/EgtB/PvdO family nonheme iron enzyme [Thermotogota bacterium]|nr:SUMF1/EgtB/PvdO family nonheme iron enzyme [Thermotogota bacterium]